MEKPGKVKVAATVKGSFPFSGGEAADHEPSWREHG